MLIPIVKLANKAKPKVLLVLPEHEKGDVMDLRDSYWKHLKMIDGMPAEEFYQKCRDKTGFTGIQDKDERESVKMKYSEDR